MDLKQEHKHAHVHGAHGHHHGAGAAGSALVMALGLTLVFVVFEVVAGGFSRSLALLSDAGHNLTDAAALGFSWYAAWIAGKPSNKTMTYGYHRVGILAALVNAVSLVVIALLIIAEGIERLRHPEPVHGWVMIVVAAIGIGVNLLISFWLHAGSKDNLNVRAAYIHMIGDALSAVCVVVAGVVIVVGGWILADPLISFAIAALILWSSWGVLKESVSVLLEGTPIGLDLVEVEHTIARVPGVLNVHDLHVWTVGPGAIACSCHILVAEQSVREGQQILQAVAAELEQPYQINHTTVQVEVEGHASNNLYCRIKNEPADEHGQPH